MSHVILNLEEQ